MEAKQTVSAAQFFGMMLVARSTLTLSLSARWAAGEGLPQALLSYLLAMALGFGLALPVWGLHRQYPTLPGAGGGPAAAGPGRGRGGPAVPFVPGGDGRGVPGAVPAVFAAGLSPGLSRLAGFGGNGGGGGLLGLPRAGGRGPVRRVRAGAAGAGHGPGVWGGGPALSAGEPDPPLPGAAPGAAEGGGPLSGAHHAVCGHGRAAALCQGPQGAGLCRLGGAAACWWGACWR